MLIPSFGFDWTHLFVVVGGRLPLPPAWQPSLTLDTLPLLLLPRQTTS